MEENQIGDQVIALRAAVILLVQLAERSHPVEVRSALHQAVLMAGETEAGRMPRGFEKLQGVSIALRDLYEAALGPSPSPP